MLITETSSIEMIKKAKPELEGYKFISTKYPSIRIPFTYAGGIGAVTIYLNEKITDGLDIVKFGIDNKYKIVAFKAYEENNIAIH